MQIDAAAHISDTPLGVEAAAVAAEADGYDGFGVAETRHDAFASLALAARATSTITLQSAIAVAFARNPMNVAVLANDIQLIAGRPVPARPRLAGPAAHRAPVLDAVESPGRADGGVHHRGPGDLA